MSRERTPLLMLVLLYAIFNVLILLFETFVKILSHIDWLDPAWNIEGLLIRCLKRNVDTTFRSSITFESNGMCKFFFSSPSK